MPFNFRALPVENLTGVTENFEQLVALRFKGTALEGSIEEPVFRKPEAFKSAEALGFEHSWKNLEAARKAEYRKDQFGTVTIRGAIASGETGKSAFKLPEKYRPKETKDFPVTTANGVAGRVKVLASGEVEINEPAGTEPKVSTFLDPISFSVE